MLFTEFKNRIPHFQVANLGGKQSQFKLAPQIRIQFPDNLIIEKKPKLAAVLALFYPDENNDTKFLLTKRAAYKGAHSAQISFPGGKLDRLDKNLLNTALRETEEEVGIVSSEIKLIREITANYIPPSNFLVSPFLAYLEEKPSFVVNYEVDTIIEIYLEDLLNDKNIETVTMSTSYMKNTTVPSFKLNNYTVWGATAMILSEIKDLIKS